MIDRTRLTKIIATVGPSTRSEKIIRNLILTDTNIFRINFSHSNHTEHLKVINIIREISKSLKKEVGIIGDLQGPKIRLNELEEPIFIQENSEIIITTETVKNSKNIVSTSYKNFVKDIEVGNRVLIDDGLIELIATTIRNDHEVICKVINGGYLKSRKGINLPDTKLTTKSFTDKDIADLKFIIENDLDFVALSFVRTSEDIVKFKQEIANLNSDIPIIAKIEKPEAIENLVPIINESYAIMVARGDLGVEIPAERVPFEQKKMVSLCNKMAKPVIIATQILESMITNSVPSRAEVNDIANAVIDGADALMLSAETASGKHPVRVVRAMDRIIKSAESHLTSYNWHSAHPAGQLTVNQTSEAVCYSAVLMSFELKSKVIGCITKGGHTALKLAKHRPTIPILAITDSYKSLRKLLLSRGIIGSLIVPLDNTVECLDRVVRSIDNQEIVKKDDIVVLTVGLPHFASDSTNTIKIHIVRKDSTGSFMS